VIQYGQPPRADAIREGVEARLRDAASAGGIRETVTVQWSDQQMLTVPVIDMPVDDLFYNPATHRIRAQRSHDAKLDAQLDEAPWSPESQDYLHTLLKALPSDPSRTDPRFDELLASLKDYGQNDPGLITQAGVLVNGNTRRAALKDLGKATMRVGVLPSATTWSEVSAVELSLQLQDDFKRDYSYINRLLAIEEQWRSSTPPEVAKRFRTTVDSCEQDLWVLRCIRELIDRSADGDWKLRLVDFEDDQEKFRELRRRWAKEAEKNRDNAELIRELRMAAIAMDFSKTDVRLIETDFKHKYLDRELPAELIAQIPEAPGETVVPGLGRSVSGPRPEVQAARAFTDAVLKAKAGWNAGDIAAERTFAAAHAAMEAALEPAGKDARIRKRKQAAPGRLKDACRDLELCASDLVLARGSRSLDEEEFDDAVGQFRKTLAKLAQEIGKSVNEPADDTAWLIGLRETES
jgi:hypothetical protein